MRIYKHNDFETLSSHKSNHMTLIYNLKNMSETFIYLEKNIIGNRLFFVTQSRILEFSVNTSDYMHMCGVKYKGQRNRFAYGLEQNKLNLKKLLVHCDGTTDAKIQVIGLLPKLFTTDTELSPGVSKSTYKSDARIQSRRKILGLDLKLLSSGLYVPLSVRNLHSDSTYHHGEKICCVLKKGLENHLVSILDSVLDKNQEEIIKSQILSGL